MNEQDQNPGADATQGSDAQPAGDTGVPAHDVAGAAGPAPDAAPAAAAPPAHGGQLLRAAREAAGLHVAALAVSLKVPVRQIEALEQGAFDRLPDPIFVRALASSVCRQLRIDSKPILAALPQAPALAPRVGGGINEPFNRPGMAAGQGVSRLAMRPPVLIAAALLLAALLLLLLPPLFEDEPVGSATPPVSSAATPVPATASATGSEPVPPASSASSLPAPGGQGGVVVERVQPLPLPGAVPGASGAPLAPIPGRTP